MTVWPYTTTAIKHYSFNGMRIAINKGGVLKYVHSDHLGSSSVETNSSGIESASRTYYAYGSTRSSSGTLQTDRTYTGQKQDGTGLLYYNARYYDPALGTFLSPDTLVPDAGQVVDYNRFLYVRGNPLKYNDPTGHETNKPDWWPPFLPWTFDLPDGITRDQFVQWASENNIPTVIGGQVGVDGGGGFVFGGTTSAELQWTFNWWSGELAYTFNNSGGGRVGTPEGSIGFHLGATFITGAHSTERSVIGPSLLASVDAQAQAVAQIGASGTWARAQNYQDTNNNGQFDLVAKAMSEPLTGAYQDPVFKRTVDGLSLNATIGGNVLNITPVDAGISVGIGDTNRIGIVDVYAPFRWLSDTFGGRR